MKTLFTLLTLSLLAFGCGDDGRSGSDGGIDAPITLDDTGIALEDTGTGDTGSAADTGTPSGACADPIADLRALDMGMGLLPRCSAETLTCLMGCADNACGDACIAADATPGADVGGGTILDCELCNTYQSNVCVDMNCTDQFAAYRCCLEENSCSGAAPCPACDADLMAVQTCAGSIPMGSCTPLVLACFPG